MRGELLPDLDALNRSIGHLYDAVVNPDLWPSALDGIAGAYGASGVNLGPLTVDRTPPSAVSEPYYVSADLQEAYEVYFRDWIWRCPINIHFGRKPEYNKTIFDVAVLSEDVLRYDPFYNEFARHYHVLHGMMRATKPASNHSGFVMISPFSGRRGIPSQQQLKIFDILSAHAARAIAIHAQLGGAKDMTGELSELFTHRNCGVILIDGTGSVIEANSKAIEMSGDGFNIGRTRVRATAPGQQHLIDGLLSRALHPSLRNHSAGPVALRRAGGKKPLLIDAIPVLSRSDRPLSGLLSSGNGILLVIADPEATTSRHGKHLFALLGLSEAEARVAAALGSGASPELTGENLGISTGTVRNHMKRIFSKLDISRQSELVALAGKLAVLH